MKTNSSIQFDIPIPCHEDWDNMTAQDKGRHCANCNKVVVDFSTMSYAEVLNYLKKTKGSVCGRVKETQLELTPMRRYANYAKVFLYAFAVIFLMGMSEVGEAQVKKDSVSSELSKIENSLKGKVVDEYKNPIQYATVEVYCDSQKVGGAITDKNGQFRFKHLKSGMYFVIVTYLGYDRQETKTFSLVGNAGMELSIQMKKGNYRMLGGVVMTKIKATYKIIDPKNPGRKIITQEQIRHTPY